MSISIKYYVASLHLYAIVIAYQSVDISNSLNWRSIRVNSSISSDACGSEGYLSLNYLTLWKKN